MPVAAAHGPLYPASMPDRFPKRIVCLTEETTETLYLLGEDERIVGISGFTVRPPRARREKPRVSAFTSAKIDKILALDPDLVLGFSDLQADIAAELIRCGIEVHVFNQRSVDEILGMIVQLGSLVGAGTKAMDWVTGWERRASEIRRALPPLEERPRDYFEEWDDPLISGITWVSELIEAAVIDGATHYQTFFKIVIPLSKNGLVSMGIFNFLGQWNQYILPLVLLTSSRKYVLSQGLAFLAHQQRYQSDWSGLFAAIAIVMLPTLIVYIIFQNQIQQGLTIGALKG